MKRLIIKYLIVAMVIPLIYSCQTDDIGEVPDQNQNIGAVTIVTGQNVVSWDATMPLGPQFIEFTLDVDGFDITEISSVDLYLTYSDNDGDIDPITGESIPLVFDRNLFANITTFPTVITITSGEASAFFGLTIDSLDQSDNFLLDFEINTGDGRTLTFALQSDLCNEPLQPASCSVSWSLVCPSDITGGFTGTWTGVTQAGAFGVFSTNTNITITDLGNGAYFIDDITAGFYTAFGFNEFQPATFDDVCNNIFITSATGQFGIGTATPGTWDPVTEILTIPWDDFGNGFGDITVFTKN